LFFSLIEKAAMGKGKVLTIGIISIGGQNQGKLIERLLDEALDELRVKYTAKCVGSHEIMVDEPSQFQGGERDIILLSCVHDSAYVYPETELPLQRMWKVAMSRAKNAVYPVHSYGIKHIKNPCDMKRSVFSHFLHAQTAAEVNAISIEEHSLRDGLQVNPSESLRGQGFEIARKGGFVWGNSLCIRGAGEDDEVAALVCIINYGESTLEWSKVSEQQMNLERAGISCLRVDAMALLVNFESALGDFFEFLTEAGVTGTPLFGIPNTASHPTDSDSNACPSREYQRTKSNSSSQGTKRPAKISAVASKKRRVVDDDSSEDENSL
jgi:AAA domain